jgi:hypothetical protein
MMPSAPVSQVRLLDIMPHHDKAIATVTGIRAETEVQLSLNLKGN